MIFRSWVFGVWSLICATGVWGDIQIVQSGPAGLRLVYEAASNAENEKALIALPLKGEVNLEIVDIVSRAAIEEMGEGETNAPAARLQSVGFLRDQRVAEVAFSPRGEGLMREKIIVDLHFSGGSRSGFAPNDRWGEDLYRRLLLNYAQGRSWRRPQSQRRAAKAQAVEGRMLKVGVRESGMYQITATDLVQAGVELEQLNPANLAMFYSGGQPLPDTVAAAAELVEIAILVEGGEDGRFDAADALVFYGEALSRWVYDSKKKDYTYIQNPYSHDNVYWLLLDGQEEGKRAARHDGAADDSEAQKPQYFRRRLHEEAEIVPLAPGTIRSGKEWYWQRVEVGDRAEFTHVIRFPGPGPLHIRLKLHGQSESDQLFGVWWNSQRVENLGLSNFGPHEFDLPNAPAPSAGLNRLDLRHTQGSRWFLDWYELEFDHEFTAENGILFFAAPLDSGKVEYRLKGFANERPRIFEVSSDLVEIVDFFEDSATGQMVFQAEAAAPPQQYIALTDARWKRPQFLRLDEPSRLRQEGNGAEYIVITHADFKSAADQLANWRASDNRFAMPLQSMVVDVEDIYDEFAGGLFDPAAIRNFLSHAADHWNPVPFFVVLLGDGSYDYKNNSGTSGGNWIPPYEDEESTYDQWYVEVVGKDFLPDMAVGRLSVQTALEAANVVDKIIAYDAEPEMGSWQGRVLLVADDTFHADVPERVEPFFVFDSEGVADSLLPAAVDVEKLYLSEFPLEGRFKPQARKEFIRLFNQGAVLLTYVGHGNSNVFAHEHIFVLEDDLAEIDNGGRLPFLYAAASQMGIFDEPLRDSIPEALLKFPSGGVIGMVAATRVGFHQSNMELARFFYDRMFRTERNYVPVGQALMEAKSLSVLNRTNIRRYSLFGDPAQRLAIPPLKVELTGGDTLKALSEVQMSGRVVDIMGEFQEDFSGRAEIQVFDSQSERRKVEQGEDLLYYQTGATLFRGTVEVEAGLFSFAFRVPKDITYRGRKGRVSVFVSNEIQTGFGSVDELVLLGTDESAAVDEKGPEIEIGFSGQDFADGDFVAGQPILQARIRDESGINVTGEIGHRIEVRLDGELIDVTDFFVAQEGYQEGIVQFSLPTLQPGEHTLVLEVWDTYNNWAQQKVRFQVSESGGLKLSEVIFHPNPLTENGHFTFVLSEPADQVHIQVFSVAGRLVDEIKLVGKQGYNQVAWVLADGLANGVYLYKIQAQSSEAEASRVVGGIQVMR